MTRRHNTAAYCVIFIITIIIGIALARLLNLVREDEKEAHVDSSVRALHAHLILGNPLSETGFSKLQDELRTNGIAKLHLEVFKPEVHSRLDSKVMDGMVFDRWQNPIYIQSTGSLNPSDLIIISPGRDKIIGTVDDIRSDRMSEELINVAK